MTCVKQALLCSFFLFGDLRTFLSQEQCVHGWYLTHGYSTGHEHGEHGLHGGLAMPVHSHHSQKDPQKVINEVKKAIDDGEGCQVIDFLVIHFI